MTLYAIFAELLLLQNLHARLSDYVSCLDTALSTIPVHLQDARTAVTQVLQVLRASLLVLDHQQVLAYLTIHQRLAVFIQVHGYLPPIDDIDGSDDSQP